MAIKRTRNIGLPVPELVKPRVGSDNDAWGSYLNSNIDKQLEFYTKLVQDSETQNQEIKRIDTEKVSTSDIPTIVVPVVVQVIEDTGKPMLDNYVEETIKPSVETYTSGKKAELDNYVNLTSKPSLDSYEKEKETELDLYLTSKKSELDSHTSEKQTQLDSYEKSKETELANYTMQKETQLNDYTIVKKSELDSRTTIKKSELDSYTSVKESELDSHTLIKKGELDTYEKEKELELETHTSQKRSDLDSYEKEKELELDNHTETKKQKITSHTDSEILRIQGEGSTQIDKVIAEGTNQIEKIAEAGEGLTPRVNALEEDKLDKGGYEGTALDLKNLIDSKPNTEVVAGQGLKSSQVGNTVTVTIESADEGILVNENNIQLNAVNDLVTGGIKRPLSAEQGKVLKQLIDALGGGGATSLLRQARILGDADYIGTLSASAVDIVVGSKLNKPTLYLDGTRMDSTTYSVELNLGKITLNEIYADYDVTWVVEDEFPSHIRFSYPTLSLLQADEQIKSIINVGDVIEILGESDADDGGQRLVKCSNELGLNGVDIGDGKYLNEIPNSKPSDKVDKSSITEELTIVDEGTVLDGRVGKTLNDIILGGQGISSIIYIQDDGEKTAGNGYIDKVTGKLYLCKNSTSDTEVTSNFSLATNIENSSRLDNLFINKTNSIQFEIPFVAKGNKYLISALTDKGGIIFINFLYEVQAVTGSDNVRVWLDDNFYGYLPCLNAGASATIISGFLIINKKIGEGIYIDSSLNDINPSRYNLYSSACFFEL